MRIAHVSDFYLPRLGGIEVQVSELAARQRRAGHSVDVLTSSSAGPRGGRKSPGVPVHRLGSGYLDPFAWSAGRALLRGGRYDLVHVHAALISPLAFSSAYAASRAGLPTVVTAHSLWAWLSPALTVLDRAVGWSEWPVAWTAVSNLAARPLREQLGLGIEVSLLPNGIEPGQWSVQPTPRAADEVVLAAVMRLAARKRPIPLLRMLRRARELVAPQIGLRAVIVGDGPQRQLLEGYLRRHRMDWVELAGRLSRPQIRGLFSRADLFVAPARLESFGIAALEARCSGLPVVARADGGIAEFVTSGRDGVLTDTDADMASAIAGLVSSPEARASLREAAMQMPVTLGWDETLASAERAYERAFRLAGRSAGPPAVRVSGRGTVVDALARP